eukprot:5607539-Prymnesium_polylepis.1
MPLPAHAPPFTLGIPTAVYERCAQRAPRTRTAGCLVRCMWSLLLVAALLSFSRLSRPAAPIGGSGDGETCARSCSRHWLDAKASAVQPSRWQSNRRQSSRRQPSRRQPSRRQPSRRRPSRLPSRLPKCRRPNRWAGEHCTQGGGVLVLGG